MDQSPQTDGRKCDLPESFREQSDEGVAEQEGPRIRIEKDFVEGNKKHRESDYQRYKQDHHADRGQPGARPEALQENLDAGDSPHQDADRDRRNQQNAADVSSCLSGLFDVYHVTEFARIVDRGAVFKSLIPKEVDIGLIQQEFQGDRGVD